MLNRVVELRAPDRLLREASVNLAETYRASGKTAEAVATMESLAKAAPQDADVQLSLANAYTADGRFDAAADAYRKVLASEPDNQAALLSLAKVLVLSRKFEEAFTAAEVYVRAYSSDWEGHYVAGRASQGKGDVSAAVRELRRAVELKPDDYEMHYFLSRALTSVGDVAGAIKELENARSLNPGAEEVLYALARTLQEAGESDRASRAFEAVRSHEQQRSRNNEAIHYERLGKKALAAGNAAAAADLFRKAIELTNEGRDHYDLALALDRLGDRTGAYRELKTATSLDPKLAAAYNQLGLLELSSNRLDEAESAFRRSLTIDTQFAEAKNNLGVLCARTGRSREAKQLFEAATEDNPAYADAYLNWGLLLAAEGDLIQCRARLQTALHLSPGLKQATTALAEVEAQLNSQRWRGKE
jgi:Flp pilus assembly protein TadD